MNKNIRKLTEGAMMCAMVGMLLVINRQLMEFFDMFLIWIVPLPVIVYVVRYGVKNGLVLSFCIFIITFILALPQTVFYTLSGSIVGVIYGYGILRHKSSSWLVSTTIIGSILVSAVTILLFASFFGYDLADQLLHFSNEISTITKLLSKDGFISFVFVKILFYLAIILSGILEGTVIHLLAFIVLRKLKIEAPIPRVVILSKGPKWIGYLAIVAILANWLAPNFTQSTQILEILLFITVVLCLIVGWYGYILLVILVRLLKARLILVIFVASLLLIWLGSLMIFVQAVLIFFVGLGLLDMVTNIRSVIAWRTQNE
jgi:Predicted membrane protein (DUF2232).